VKRSRFFHEQGTGILRRDLGGENKGYPPRRDCRRGGMLSRGRRNCGQIPGTPQAHQALRLKLDSLWVRLPK